MQDKKYTILAEAKTLERLQLYQPNDDVAIFARYLFANVDSKTEEYVKYFEEDSIEFAALARELDISKESLKQGISRCSVSSKTILSAEALQNTPKLPTAARILYFPRKFYTFSMFNLTEKGK